MIRRSQLLERLFNIRLQIDSADSLLSSLAGHCQLLAREVLEHGTTQHGYSQLVNLLHRVGVTEEAIRDLDREVVTVDGKAYIPREESEQ
jgi:hypothetical protein